MYAAALLYPLKKGFPISTYVETIALTFQSLLVLGTLSHFKGRLKEFFAGKVYMLILLWACTYKHFYF